MRALKCLVVPALLVCLVPSVRAQSPADQQTLADLKTASKRMNLEQPDGSPFHLQATIETTDYQGHSLGASKWVEDYSSHLIEHRTVTNSGNARGVSEQSGASEVRAPYMQRYLIDAVIQPGPSNEMLDDSQISYRSEKIGDVSLRCVVLQPKVEGKDVKTGLAVMPDPQFARAYCLSANEPVIRLVQLQYGFLVTYNGLTRMGARLYAKDTVVSHLGKKRGSVHMEAMEPAPEIEQTNGAAPISVSDKDYTQHPVELDGARAGAKTIKKVAPVYPAIAKQEHMSGTVYLSILIDELGNVSEIEVISAPSPELAKSARDAVSQWKYAPFVIEGKPAKVATVATVQYTIGRSW